MKKTPHELLEDDQMKKLGKNNEAKMTFYNALLHKEYERVFMCKTAKEVWHTLIITHQGNSQVKTCKIDLLTQEYDKFSISNEESFNNAFTRFNAIRAKVTAIEEAKDLATLPLNELVGNLKVYDMILENDSVVFKTTTKEKVKSLALKAKVTREQTRDDSDSQDESDEDEEINLMAKNFRKLSRKDVTKHDKFDICKLKTKGGESSRRERGEDGDEPLNDATCFMAIDSQEFSKDFSKTYEKLLQEKRDLEKEHSKILSKVNELDLEVKKLASNEKVIEPCQKCADLTQEVNSLKSNVSRLQDETLNFLKFKKSCIVLDDMLSRQNFSQDKEGLGFSKSDKTTSEIGRSSGIDDEVVQNQRQHDDNDL
ncbi:hypothetical protein Tco_1215132 [Tanacetum coccineum]